MTMCIVTKTRRRSLLEASQFKAETAYKTPVNMEENQPSMKKREIQHNYHDHANDDGKIYMETPLVSKGGVTVPFPMKLHNMLEHIAQNEPELEHIVSWQPHGRCFLVHKINKFQEDVLPRFFQQKKYASFQRQLNLYGFSRLTTGLDKGSYYHELFLRSKQILCRGINRMKVKGTGSRMASNPDQEPNFYQMISMPSNPSGSKVEPLNHQQQETLPQQQQQQQQSVPNSYMSNSNYDLAPAPSAYNSINYESENYEPLPANDDTEIVFDNMQFHALNEVSRRHSLMMDGARRISFQFGKRGSFVNKKRGSIIVTGDSDFDAEMEMIHQLAEKSLSDDQMSEIMDRIVDHQIFQV